MLTVRQFPCLADNYGFLVRDEASGKTATILVTLQIFLGIATLVYQAPLALSALHQITAALLFCAAVWHAHELRKPAA